MSCTYAYQFAVLLFGCLFVVSSGSGNKLSATIPGTVASLDALSLKIDGDKLVSTIPGTIVGTVSVLQSLQSKGDRLASTIPGTIPSLIDLTDNKFTATISGTIPHNFESLQPLDVTDDKLAATIPSLIGFTDNKLSATIPGTIPGTVSSIQSLDMTSGNKLAGTLPVMDAILSDNKLTATIPALVRSMASDDKLAATGPIPGTVPLLQALDVAESKLGATIPGTVAELKSLDLSDNKLRATIPGTVASAQSVQTDVDKVESNAMRQGSLRTANKPYVDSAVQYESIAAALVAFAVTFVLIAFCCKYGTSKSSAKEPVNPATHAFDYNTFASV